MRTPYRWRLERFLPTDRRCINVIQMFCVNSVQRFVGLGNRSEINILAPRRTINRSNPIQFIHNFRYWVVKWLEKEIESTRIISLLRLFKWCSVEFSIECSCRISVYIICKGKRQYLLTYKVSRYCLLSLQGSLFVVCLRVTGRCYCG